MVRWRSRAERRAVIASIPQAAFASALVRHGHAGQGAGDTHENDNDKYEENTRRDEGLLKKIVVHPVRHMLDSTSHFVR